MAPARIRARSKANHPSSRRPSSTLPSLDGAPATIAHRQASDHLARRAGHLAGASVGIAILTPNPKGKFQDLFDAGQAAAYMQLAAWELGVGSCLASIYEPDLARQILGYPDDWHLRIAISFGYPADEAKLTSAPKQGGRRSLEELVHWERW